MCDKLYASIGLCNLELLRTPSSKRSVHLITISNFLQVFAAEGYVPRLQQSGAVFYTASNRPQVVGLPLNLKLVAMMDPNGMTLWEEEPELHSPVADYYRDKVVLLTGATGFLGKLYTCKLFRCGVKELIVIVREKKGLSPKERMEKVMEKERIFKVHGFQKEDYLKKITVIDGDMELPRVGLSEEDLEYVKERTEIVLHAAADVRFDEALNKIIITNVQGTLEILNLCVSMRKMELLIYISTAYANCVNMTVYEQFYEPPMDPLKMMELMKTVDDEQSEILTQMIIQPWPNTYTYAKNLAEQLVKMYFDKINIVIVRPSVVASTMEDPIQGWTDNLYGLNGVIVGAGCGILRVLNAADHKRVDVIPADYVINGTLVAAHRAAEDYRHNAPSTEPDKVHIYHVASGVDNPLTNGMIQKLTKTIGADNPPLRSLWIGSYVSNESPTVNMILAILLHFIPGMIIDALLNFKGKKPRLMKIYRKVRKFTKTLEFFSTQEFTFVNDKMRQIIKTMTPGDKKHFQCDMRTITWEDYFNIYYPGLKMYLLKEGTETWEAAKQRYDRLDMITIYSAKAAVVFGIYWIICYVLNLYFPALVN
ncbi:fatty acyl-CoA reductase wat-like [Armigeres subalbatus]|uniref:fatty acyl-CoA reductase wat-like n=1 Tax=Armigeres subalbatus TaxID=124917 RepID=UPI002ED2F082